MSETTTKAKRTVVKEVPNATLYSDGTIVVKNLRFSYPHVFKQGQFEGADSGYSIVGLADKKTHGKAAALINAEIDTLLKEKKAKVSTDKRFLRDGDESDKTEAEGNWTINARDTKRPDVRGPDKRPMMPDEAGKVYGGCWGNIMIRPWYQDNKFGKRVNANLIAVQLVKDGEPFGEGRISADTVDDSFDDETGSDDDL